jgi:hypothetical protein
MKRNRFINSPVFLTTVSIMSVIGILLFIVCLASYNNGISLPIFIITLILVFSMVIFFVYLIYRFIYLIEIDERYIYCKRANKSIKEFDLQKVEIYFTNEKYGIVNIEEKREESKDKQRAFFEFSKKRKIIIEKYYKRKIGYVPPKYR